MQDFQDILETLSEEDKAKHFDFIDGNWIPKPIASEVSFSMYIDKAVYHKESQEMRWHCVASDIDDDSYDDNMTLELFDKFLSRIETKEQPPEKYCSDFWAGGMPYLSLSHYSDQNGDAVPGPVETVYVDGKKLKGKGTFFKNELGFACFDAINKDKHGIRKSDDDELDHPVRISIAFLDYRHRHKSNDAIFERENLDDVCLHCVLESLTGTGEGKEYLDGHLIHLGMTRIPVNKRTEMEVSKSMATRKDDAASIVGEEAAKKLAENEETFRSDALVTMSDEDVEEEPVVEEAEVIPEVEPVTEEVEEVSALQQMLSDYQTAFDEVVQAEISQTEKLQAMQIPLERLASITRAELEGVTVEEAEQAVELETLRSQVAQQNEELAALRQDMQLLSQTLADKSNVQKTEVPQPRSIQPTPEMAVQYSTAQEKPTGLKALIRNSVGLDQ